MAIAIIVHCIISGGLSAWVAREKGYGGGLGFVVGLFFGILGLIAVAGLPSKEEGGIAEIVRVLKSGEKRQFLDELSKELSGGTSRNSGSPPK